jgi:hypothetical protein
MDHKILTQGVHEGNRLDLGFGCRFAPVKALSDGVAAGLPKGRSRQAASRIIKNRKAPTLAKG